MTFEDTDENSKTKSRTLTSRELRSIVDKDGGHPSLRPVLLLFLLVFILYFLKYFAFVEGILTGKTLRSIYGIFLGIGEFFMGFFEELFALTFQSLSLCFFGNVSEFLDSVGQLFC